MFVFVPASAPRPTEGDVEGYFAQLREGYRFLWHTPLVRAIVIMVLVTNTLDAGMGGVLMPVYADRVLNSVVALGLMAGAMGLTAFAGTLVFAWIGHRAPRLATLVIGFTLGGPMRFFLLAAMPGIGPAVIGFAIAGIGIGPINPILGTLGYERVPPELRARVFGALSAGVMAGAPIGALLAAACVELGGLQATLIAFGVIYLVCTLSPLVVPAWRDLAPPSRAGLAHGAASVAPASAGDSSSNSSPNTLCEGGGRRGLHVVDGDRPPELPGHRRELGVVEAAGGDPLGKGSWVEVDVERKAVRRHPARHAHADRGDLPRPPRSGRRHPDARQALDRGRGEVERAERLQDRLLQVTDVLPHVLAVAVEVEDRITDELPGSVVRRLAAAIRLGELDRGAGRDVELRRLVGPPPRRDHRRMLHQDHGVGDLSLRHGDRERPLQLERLAVRDEPGVEQGGTASVKPLVRLLPALEPLAQVAEEAAAVGAVDEPVVVGEREVHQRPDRDHVLAELVLDDPGALDERVGAEDPDLRLADDRRAVEGAEAARVRDRERAALDVVGEQLLRAGAGRDVGDRAGRPEQVEVLRVLDHRHDQALAVLERDGDAEVDPGRVTIDSPRISALTHG